MPDRGFQRPAVTSERGETTAFEFTDRDFRRVCKMIYARAGIHLGENKRDMVYSRLSRRLRALGLQRFADYLDLVEQQPEQEEQAFINALTTNLTSFFREAHHFDALREQLRALPRGSHADIWCCAASTGEEPWSLAITACEAFASDTPPVRILATDIDTNALATAERGIYGMDRITDLSAERKRRFFLRGTGPNEGRVKVKPFLQRLVEFRQLNLLAPDYGLRQQFIAVFCRNVMIYFDKPTQYEVLRKIVPLLAPGGRFYAGHSESFTHALDLLQPCGRTIYRATREAG
ncbi:MAG: chemotaxis protein CheR [Thermomonas hydrothermalis]|uniref:CheR family methyltransferase n=1 Tax=Thermomonas hydrothermalis TaxID=213588 RepID=UPI002353E92E|nr:CheR family methyltransferase [Thermomonas hydrothermalis]MCL6618991.1 chemotaxis protein CheR [Thermomonas hydrothermalis]